MASIIRINGLFFPISDRMKKRSHRAAKELNSPAKIKSAIFFLLQTGLRYDKIDLTEVRV